MVPRRRRHSSRSLQWPEERVYLVSVVAGLLLLALSYRAFHQKAAERIDALQQLRAAKQARGGGSAAAGRSFFSRAAAGFTVDSHRDAVQGAAEGAAATESSSTRNSGSHDSGRAGGRVAIETGGLDKPPALQQDGGSGVATGSAGGSGGWPAGQYKSELQQYCEQHFGLEWVKRWGAAAQQVCSATQQLQAGGGGGSNGGSGQAWGQGKPPGQVQGQGSSPATSRAPAPAPSTLTCRSIVDPHMPVASAPHVLCDATNLRLDPSRLRRARCPRHRPGYLCLTATYHHYQRGAWALNCTWLPPGFRLQHFSKDHQQDIFESMVVQPEGGTEGGSIGGAQYDALFGKAGTAGSAGSVQVEELPTLLVTREVREHANVFHTFTDMLNTYITLVLLGWQHTHRQVVLLDAHPPGSLDILWPVAAAGGGPAALAAIRSAQAHQQQGQQQEGQQQEGQQGHQQQQQWRRRREVGKQQGLHPWDVRISDGGSGSSSSSSGTSGLDGSSFNGSSGAGDSDSRGSGGGSGSRLLVRRVEDFPGPVLFRHAAFVPPGYSSLLFAHLYEDSSCPLPTSLFAGFRSFLLASFGLLEGQVGGAAGSGGGGAAAGEEAAGEAVAGAGEAAAQARAAAGVSGSSVEGGSGGSGAVGGSSGAGSGSARGHESGAGSGGGPLTIRLISRRPTRSKPKMDRQIANEQEIVDMLRGLGGMSARDSGGGDSGNGSGSGGSGMQLEVSVSLLDFAELSVEQQLAVVQQTDVLIGMHGAALAHALLLPPHAALVELWPQAEGIWRCYQNMAQWAGALYRRVAASDPSQHLHTPSGDATQVDISQLQRVMQELLPLVHQRRRQRQQQFMQKGEQEQRQQQQEAAEL